METLLFIMVGANWQGNYVKIGWQASNKQSYDNQKCEQKNASIK